MAVSTVMLSARVAGICVIWYTGELTGLGGPLVMLPDFNDDGLLPAGIHLATIEEFEERFVFFGRTDRRFRLFESICSLHEAAQRSGIVRQMLIGGSYVTSIPEPNDFDCILVFDASIQGLDLPPTEYNLIAADMARRIYRGDIYPVLDGSEQADQMIEFFQTTRQKTTVGMVEIEL